MWKEIDRSFWKGRRVFLTGHTGFKGSWLSLWLKTLGADVTGYALEPPTHPSLFEQAGVSAAVKSICADVRDFLRLKTSLADARPEVVIHMAAQTVVRRGYEDPVETYSTNVMGTANLLQALREVEHPCVVVVVTSDKCYENREWAWGYREIDRLGGHDPYSNSKACQEFVAATFRESYFHAGGPKQFKIAVATARAGNVIGGGDWTKDQLVPELVRSFLEERPCLIRCPSATRPWQFVMEPLRGYLMLAQALAIEPERFGSGWNFGPGQVDMKPVSWIADRLVELWGDGAAWRADGGVHPAEAGLLKLDSSKAKSELGWEPVKPLSKALGSLVQWYRAFQEGADLQRVTRTQIEEYEHSVTESKLDPSER